jgi:hypothetical protein
METSKAVGTLIDAQFTIAKVLRPFAGFEAVYQNQDASIPIAFPGTLDENAGKPGFSPYLLAGLAVPLGAKMEIWFPMIDAPGGEGNNNVSYVYLLHWRMRNIGDFVRSKLPYHLMKDAFGAPDTLLAPVPPQRFVLPSAVEAVLYQQQEPAAPAGFLIGAGPGRGNLRTEQIAVPNDLAASGATAGLPFLPPNTAPPFANAFPVGSGNTTPLGAFEQGITDPNADPLAPYSLFRPYFTVAKADELIISVVRLPLDPLPVPNNWDFAGVDAQFSNVYGNNAAGPTHPLFPDLGVYVLAGSNPS